MTKRKWDSVEVFSPRTEVILLWLFATKREQHLLEHKSVSLKHNQNKDVKNASAKE